MASTHSTFLDSFCGEIRNMIYTELLALPDNPTPYALAGVNKQIRAEFHPLVMKRAHHFVSWPRFATEYEPAFLRSEPLPARLTLRLHDRDAYTPVDLLALVWYRRRGGNLFEVTEEQRGGSYLPPFSTSGCIMEAVGGLCLGASILKLDGRAGPSRTFGAFDHMHVWRGRSSLRITMVVNKGYREMSPEERDIVDWIFEMFTIEHFVKMKLVERDREEAVVHARRGGWRR